MYLQSTAEQTILETVCSGCPVLSLSDPDDNLGHMFQVEQFVDMLCDICRLELVWVEQQVEECQHLRPDRHQL